MKTHSKKHRLNSNEFDHDYYDPDHGADFIRALSNDVVSGSESGAEHILASSEIMPATKSAIKKMKREEIGTPNGLSYTLLRYPLMLVIGTIIVVELLLYGGLRQIVRAWENFFSWRGQRRKLRNNLRAAQTYEEWCRAADALDKYMGKDTWKESAPHGYYDYRLIQKVVRHLQTYRKTAAEDPEAALNLKDVLYACLKQNFAGVENAKLYSNTYLGTKKLIELYVKEVTLSIDALANCPHISVEDKRLAFKLYSKNYGRTALCFSGGAGYGCYHLGVVRGLLDQKVLPNIITGTSAGALFGALVCCRTDEELEKVLVPELSSKILFVHDTILGHLARYAKTGAVFSAEEWIKMISWFTRGSLTFKEAYERTGRIFNVAVIPYDPHSPPKLLNYITAPNCVIWSAVMASAAIPGILNPVVLMQKSPKSKHLTPYNYGHKFKDGSLRTDIPTHTLNTHFNVNYTIVSQVNPHIHVFFFGNQGSPGRPVTHRWGKGWRGGFLASACEQFLKLDLTKWLKVVRDLDLLPKILNQDWSSIWLQKFDGTVTILPKTSISDLLHIVRNPSPERLKYVMYVGESRTWPKIAMISSRLSIENAIKEARDKLKSKKEVKAKHNRNSKKKIFGASDDESESSDEAIFLFSGRRASMPDGSAANQERELRKEHSRRRRFLAQFTDQRLTGLGKGIAEGKVQFSSSDSSEDTL